MEYHEIHNEMQDAIHNEILQNPMKHEESITRKGKGTKQKKGSEKRKKTIVLCEQHRIPPSPLSFFFSTLGGMLVSSIAQSRIEKREGGGGVGVPRGGKRSKPQKEKNALVSLN